MERYKVIVSKHYHQDLRSILSYMVHELKVPEAASDFLDAVEQAVLGLKEIPNRFELLKDERLRQAGYRKCSIGNYLLSTKSLNKEKLSASTGLYTPEDTGSDCYKIQLHLSPRSAWIFE